ncbi:hypothetical protein AB5J62_34435 [Amycolatopsis sp. cg5]|uniref:hypothetical protein n=1 Tax=Amycolatopsis sp. cg5 TaxID=3238802 RepID=UPI003524080B
MRLFAVLAAVLTLAGCTATVPEGPERTPDYLQLAGHAVFGDFNTVDYCSLLDPASATKHGGTEPTKGLSSFDYCSLLVKVGGKEVTVEVGYLATKESRRVGDRVPDENKKLPHGLVAERGTTPGESDCAYYLRFIDQVTVRATASRYAADGVPKQVLCEISADVLDGIIASVSANQVRHRIFRTGSLGTADACALLDDARVSSEIGTTTTRSVLASKHRCEWVAPGGSSVLLNFVNDVLPPDAAEVTPYPPKLCKVQKVLGPAPDAKVGEVEFASLTVNSMTDKEPCAVASALAAAAWPKLPAA